MRIFLIIIIALLALTSSPADARYGHHRRAETREVSWGTSFKTSEATPFAASAIGRPARYVGGHLICAINVGNALAERGIKGTGSALAHSYDRWGRSSSPVPGAVAVTDRRGGGHVAIVSRVEGGRVFVWDPQPGSRGWREVEYTNRRARYRVAS